MTSAASGALLARRRAVAAERGRRRRTILLCVIATAAAVAGGWWVVTGPPGRIASVEVTGYDGPDSAAVEETIRIVARRGTVVDPPVELLRQATAGFPWVEGLEVSRDLPRGISVQVLQARPGAVAVPDTGPRVLLSSSGRVLGPVPSPAPSVPRVRVGTVDLEPGQTITDPATRAALAFSEGLSAKVAVRVLGLHEERGALIGRLAAGPELRVGLPEDLSAKAAALELVLGQLSAEEERSASYIDLSVPSRPAVGTLAVPPPPPAPSTTSNPSPTPAEPSITN
jgi:cell division septal protein FtsQ